MCSLTTAWRPDAIQHLTRATGRFWGEPQALGPLGAPRMPRARPTCAPQALRRRRASPRELAGLANTGCSRFAHCAACLECATLNTGRLARFRQSGRAPPRPSLPGHRPAPAKARPEGGQDAGAAPRDLALVPLSPAAASHRLPRTPAPLLTDTFTRDGRTSQLRENTTELIWQPLQRKGQEWG